MIVKTDHAMMLFLILLAIKFVKNTNHFAVSMELMDVRKIILAQIF